MHRRIIVQCKYTYVMNRQICKMNIGIDIISLIIDIYLSNISKTSGTTSSNVIAAFPISADVSVFLVMLFSRNLLLVHKTNVWARNILVFGSFPTWIEIS